MTLVAKVDNVALPDGALLIGGAPNSSIPGGIQGLPTAAYFGEAMFGGLSIDDPEGIYDFDGLHTFTVDETADTGRPRIWNGLLTGRRVHRGPYSSGPSRVWDIDIWEMNLLFALMVFRAESAHRPAETDLVRAQFIIESQPMAFTPTVDNGRANFTDNPINFDESDLVSRYPIEALNEFAGIAGKNFYNYWDQDAEENSFHYDLIGVGPAAEITITNDEADTLDSTTYRPFLDAELDEGAEWTVTGMLLNYKGAYAYGIRQATIDALSPTIFSPDEFQRDEVYRTDRVGKLSTANSLIQSMLLDRATDRATIRCSIRVPAAVVNTGTQAGQLVTVKFTHLPGYEAETDIPIIRRNVVPTEGRVDMYDVHLELSGVGKPTGPGGGVPGVFPPPRTCSVGNVGTVQAGVPAVTTGPGIGEGFIDMTSPPTPGNVVFLVTMNFEPTSNNEGWTGVTGFTAITGELNEPDRGMQSQAWYRVAEAGDTAHIHMTCDTGGFGDRAAVAFVEYSGVDTLDDFDGFVVSPDPAGSNPQVIDLGTVTPTAGATGLLVSFMIPSLDQNDPWGTVSLDSPLDEDTRYDTVNASRVYIIVGHEVIANTAGSYTPSLTTTYPPGNNMAAWMAGTFTFLCSGDATGLCPDTGQPNTRPEVVTLTGPDGTTACPFADGTLHVYIDNVEQTDKLVSQDGVTGDFTLGFDPTPTEVCTVEYLGR